MFERPVLDFSPDIVESLNRYPRTVREQLHAWIEQRLCPTYLLETSRVSGPQRLGSLGRLMGKKESAPVLPSTVSKFGGIPYLESEDEWPSKGGRRLQYLGQLNLSEPPPHVPDVPREGLVVLFLDRDWPCENPVACRYYRNPSLERAVREFAPLLSIAPFEASVRFRPSWDLSWASTWERLLPAKDEQLWDELNDWHDETVRSWGKRDGMHEMWGHASSALLEDLREEELTDRRVLLYCTYDHAADFAWGSNCLYVVIDEPDLRSNRFDRSKSFVANV